MALSKYVSVMLRGILMWTPCLLMWIRIGAAGCEHTRISSSSDGPCDNTQSWKKLTENALSTIIFVHSPRSGGVKGTAGTALSNVGGVGRDKCFKFRSAPHRYTSDYLYRYRGAHNSFFCGVGCDAADL